jgi:hypothetical protein
MPLQFMLSKARGGSFDPHSVSIMLEAFEGVVADLHLSEISERETAARLIIELATDQKDLNAASLRDRVATIVAGNR